jgi:hypothetical protein
VTEIGKSSSTMKSNRWRLVPVSPGLGWARSSHCCGVVDGRVNGRRRRPLLVSGVNSSRNSDSRWYGNRRWDSRVDGRVDSRRHGPFLRGDIDSCWYAKNMSVSNRESQIWITHVAVL